MRSKVPPRAGRRQQDRRQRFETLAATIPRLDIPLRGWGDRDRLVRATRKTA